VDVIGKRDKSRYGMEVVTHPVKSPQYLSWQLRSGGLQPDEPHVKKFMPIVIILAFKIIIGEKYSTLVTLILL
jgi:hypothetical protein